MVSKKLVDKKIVEIRSERISTWKRKHYAVFTSYHSVKSIPVDISILARMPTYALKRPRVVATTHAEGNPLSHAAIGVCEGCC